MLFLSCLFFFNATETTEIYTLSLHDALPISTVELSVPVATPLPFVGLAGCVSVLPEPVAASNTLTQRSEEHTSELQSLAYLVCRLLLEKKKKLIYFKKSQVAWTERLCLLYHG